MLTAVDITNTRGNTLQLPLRTAPGGYIVRDIEGLDPVAASLVTSTTAQVDGAEPQNARRDSRNITMKLGLRPVYAVATVESLRLNLYDYFLPKANISLGFYEDDVLSYITSGQVESCDAPRFSADPEADISVLCYDPDFYAPDNTLVTSHTQSDNITTIPINYIGSSETGLIFTMTLTRPMTALDLVATTPDGITRTFSLTGTFLSGDVLTINTIPKQKEVTVLRSGVVTDVLYYMGTQSTWPLLQKGLNQFAAYSPGAGVSYGVSFTPKFGGI